MVVCGDGLAFAIDHHGNHSRHFLLPATSCSRPATQGFLRRAILELGVLGADRLCRVASQRGRVVR